MGLMDSINRALFTLTYNEQASKAYDEQNAKAAGAVDDLKKIIQNYRDTREKIIGAGEASDYFATNALARITEWENWLEKNAGLAAGDYSKKETEMKTQWESILNSNKIVQEMERVSPFIQLYLKDKGTKIPSAERKDLETLKTDAETYYNKIVKQTPADIIAKRDEFNRRFEEIQKKIPENFEDLKESFQDSTQAPVTLLDGIKKNRYDTYEAQVNQKEKADENSFNFGRLVSQIQSYSMKGFSTFWPYFFGAVFAMIVANDAIGRPAFYRLFYFVFMFLLFQVSLIPGFPFLVFAYYLYRAFSALNWGNIFTLNPTGPRMDFLKAPVLFAFLPLLEGGQNEKVSWYWRPFKYDVNDYGGLAQKKRLLYEQNAGILVGKEINGPTLQEKFSQIVANVQTLLTNVPRGTLEEAVEGIKKQAE